MEIVFPGIFPDSLTLERWLENASKILTKSSSTKGVYQAISVTFILKQWFNLV